MAGAGGSFGELGRFEIPIDIALEKLVGDLSKAARAYSMTVDMILRKTNEVTAAGTTAQRAFAQAARTNAHEIQKLNNVAIGGQRALQDVLNKNKAVMATMGRGVAVPRGAAGGGAAVTGAAAAFGAQSGALGLVNSQMKMLIGQLGLAYVSYRAIRSVTLDAAAAQIRFESSFAGVRKTVKATEAEFAALESQIRALSLTTPIDVNELNNIASAAGQLGIAKDNIIDFTETIAMLGVTTNLTTERAALALAQWANITQLPQDQIRNLASAIVDLGNNSATMESNIVEMGLRIAGAGKLIGLTDAEIAGFAAAIASLGIEAEAGGTAVSRIMSTVAQSVRTASPQLALFAALAGQTEEAFSNLFDANAAEAIIRVVEGMGKLEKAGGNLFTVLEELELADIRVRDALLRAAGAGDLMRESMDRGTESFRENTALAKEAEERYKTTESQIQLMKNAFGDLQIAMGEAFSPAMRSLIEGVTEALNYYNDSAGNALVATDSFRVSVEDTSGSILSAAGSVLDFGGAFTRLALDIDAAWNKLRGFMGAATGAAPSRDFGGIAAYLNSEQAQKDAAEQNAEIPKVVEEAAAAADDFAKNVAGAMDGIKKGSEAAGSAAKKAADEQKRAARVMADALDDMLREMEAKLAAVRGLVERAIPVEGLIGDLSEIAGLFADVPEAFGENLDVILQGAIGQYAEAGGEISDAIIAQVMQRIPGMAEQIKAAMEAVRAEMSEQANLAMLPEMNEELLAQIEAQYAPMIEKFGEVFNVLGMLSAELQHFGREGATSFQRIAGGAGTVVSAVLSVVGTYVALQAAATAAATTAAAAWIAILGPIALVVAAVNAAASVFGLFGDKAEDELSDTEQMIEDIKQAFDDFLSDLTDAIVEFVKNGEFNFNQLLEGLLEDLLRIGIDATITDPIRGALGISDKSAAASVTSTKGIGTDGAALFDDMPGGGAKVEVNIIDQRTGTEGGVDVSESTRSDGTRVIDAVIYDSVRRQMDAGKMDGVLMRNYQGLARRGKRRAR